MYLRLSFLIMLLCYLPLKAQVDTFAFATTQKDTVLFSSLSFEDFKKAAAFENKPYFIMFSAPWCKPCHRIKNEIFTLPKIVQLANEQFLAYYVDIENFDGMEINEEFKITQLPTILFFDPKGNRTDKATGFFDGYYFFLKMRSKIPPHLRNVEWDHIYQEE
jgi:thioredoxin-related protein